MLTDINTPKGGCDNNICQQHPVLLLLGVVNSPADNITANNIIPEVEPVGREVVEVGVVAPQRLAAGVVESSADRQHLLILDDPP